MKTILSLVVGSFIMTAASFSTVNVSSAQVIGIDDPRCVFHPAYREYLYRMRYYCGPSAGRGMFTPPETPYEGDKPDQPAEMEPEIIIIIDDTPPPPPNPE